VAAQTHHIPLRAGIVLGAALALAACGEDRETGTGTTTDGKTGTETAAAPTGKPLAKVSVTEDEYKIRPATISLKRAGAYEFEVRNVGKIGHALEIEGEGMEVETKTFGPGRTAKLKADLEPGTYELYCPVADHAQRGMTARLTVRGRDRDDYDRHYDKTDRDGPRDDYRDEDYEGRGPDYKDDSGGAPYKDDKEDKSGGARY
jgi:uncharacterized cupredoxin-like copper-binding protein